MACGHGMAQATVAGEGATYLHVVCSVCGVDIKHLDLIVFMRERAVASRVTLELIQAALVAPDLWEERVRRVLAIVTKYLTSPE